MNWTWYLFGFEGRINRARYWLACPIILSFMIVFANLVYLTLMLHSTAHGVNRPAGPVEVSFGFGLDDILAILDRETWRTFSYTKVPMLMVKATGSVVVLWVHLATSIKRLHDRDRSGWWIVPFVAIPLFFDRIEDALPDSYFSMIAGAIVFVLLIWGIAELYFLRGTGSTNRFGADPLNEQQQTRPRSAQDRLQESTPGHPSSEIEMVPHTSGPSPVGHDKPRAHD